MVITTIATQDAKVATKKVWASQGKYARAEPCSALYEKGLVHHVGMFAELEDQLCNWVPGEGLPSPNELDACVWALTEILLNGPHLPAVDLARAIDGGTHHSFLDRHQRAAWRQRFPQEPGPAAGASVEAVMRRRWGVAYDPDDEDY